MCNETLCFLVSSALGSLIPGHMRGVSSSCNFSCNSIDLVSQSESRIQILLQFDWMAWFSLLQPDGCCKNFEKRWKPSFLSCSLGPRLCSGLHVHLQVTCGGKHVLSLSSVYCCSHLPTVLRLVFCTTPVSDTTGTCKPQCWRCWRSMDQTQSCSFGRLMASLWRVLQHKRH